MNYTYRKRTVSSSGDRVLVLQQPFSEDDILTMHEVLLTPGIHYIAVSSISEGRQAITTFLDSLNYYHKVGCMTLASEPLSHTEVTDVVHDLAERDLLSSQVRMGSYFATEFDYDCLWIEAEKPLFHELWFKRFFDELEQLHTAIPVIVFLYDISL